ncbi:MAG: hypothetical protein OEY97_06040 [Nitrospirota bacterium]|nr:hypothetical protein [Nitrospirota bacterium]
MIRDSYRWRAVTAGLLLALASAPAVLAQDAGMSLALTARAAWGPGAQIAQVTAGIAPQATDAYDPGLDVPALLAGPLQVWFHQNGMAISDLKRDMRGAAGDWELHVATPATGLGASIREGSTITLSWEPPVNSGGVCSGRAVTLTDGAAVIDMTAQRSHSFPASAAGGERVLTLTLGAASGGDQAAPQAPDQPRAPRVSRRGVLLVWQPVPGVAGYHVERSDNPDAAADFQRLTGDPVREARWLDDTVPGGAPVLYRVIAVSGGGCESTPSPGLPLAP